MIFSDPIELQNQIDAYFAYCDSTHITVPHKQLGKGSDTPINYRVQRPYTIDGLAQWLGTNRMTLLNYQNSDHKKQSDIIGAAKQKIATDQIEKCLVGAVDGNVARFMLINNHGFKNEKSIDHTTGGEKITKIIVG